MNSSFLKTILGLALLSAAFLLINILFYQFGITNSGPDQFKYPLVLIYSFFYLLSLVIFAVLNFVKSRHKEQLGFAFLFLTAGKMALSYVLARPLIANDTSGGAEKVNFFVVFIIFLAIESYYTAQLLNNKQ